MPNDKLYRQIRRDSADRINFDIREKERKDAYKHVDKYDKDLLEKGIQWFNSGLSLDEAPMEIRNNSNFVRDFEKGKRLSIIAELQTSDSKKR